jgi:peroxiredoxin
MKTRFLSAVAIAALLAPTLAFAGGAQCTSSASASACAEFGACTIDKNLMGAKSGELAKYTAEKETSGQAFADWRAPDFTLPATSGGEVSLSAYRGRPVALVLMAAHCYHCVDTMPILNKLSAKYASAGLVVLPVMVNGSIEGAREWAKTTGAGVPILVAKGQDLSKKYETRLVPATFLINGDGYVTKKYVTFQKESDLDVALAELVRAGASSAAGGSK